MNTYPALLNTLEKYGQTHLLDFFDRLDPEAQQRYAEELAALDLELLSELIQSHVLQKPVIELPADLEPAPYFPLKPRNAAEEEYYRQADAAGEVSGGGDHGDISGVQQLGALDEFVIQGQGLGLSAAGAQLIGGIGDDNIEFHTKDPLGV